MTVYFFCLETQTKTKENRIRAIKKNQNKCHSGIFPGNWNNCDCWCDLCYDLDDSPLVAEEYTM